MLRPLGSLRVTELLKPAPQGERVNPLVIRAVPEPQPDYEAMHRLAKGAPPASSPHDEQRHALESEWHSRANATAGSKAGHRRHVMAPMR
jgi:hypothetical protein